MLTRTRSTACRRLSNGICRTCQRSSSWTRLKQMRAYLEKPLNHFLTSAQVHNLVRLQTQYGEQLARLSNLADGCYRRQHRSTCGTRKPPLDCARLGAGGVHRNSHPERGALVRLVKNHERSSSPAFMLCHRQVRADSSWIHCSNLSPSRMLLNSLGFMKCES